MKFVVDNEVSLRLLQPADADALFEVVDSNRAYLKQWLPWLDSNTTPDDSRNYIESIQQQLDAGSGFACGVFFEDILVGMCGFHEIDQKHYSIAIGYWLAEGFQKRGIISRCSTFFISYAFDEMGLSKVLIPVAIENAKSRAVCERLGFVSEGIEIDAENLYGTFVDHIRYAMNADRWNYLRRNGNA